MASEMYPPPTFERSDVDLKVNRTRVLIPVDMLEDMLLPHCRARIVGLALDGNLLVSIELEGSVVPDCPNSVIVIETLRDTSRVGVKHIATVEPSRKFTGI